MHQKIYDDGTKSEIIENIRCAPILAFEFEVAS